MNVAARTPDLESLAAEVGFDLPAQYNAGRILWDNLERNPDATAIIHDGGNWTYAELVAEAARIGNYLRDRAAPGDRVLLFMDDEPAYPAAIMGAMRAGLVPMLINTLSPRELIDFFLEDSGAKLVVASSAFRAAFDADAPVIDAGLRPWADAPATLAEHPTTRDDMAFWMYSSGSTGRPKGVVHRHEDVPYINATYAAHVLHLTPGDICFSVPKVYFAYGFGNSVVFPFAAGAAVVLLSGRPDPAAIFDQIARHRPSVFFGLPTLYTALMHHKGAESADLSSLRLCLSAAEVLSADIANAWRKLSGLPIVEGLGSTEMLHIYISNSEARQVNGSAGRVVPGYAVRLVTPEGAEAGPGEEGVMQVRGLSATRGYWNRPEKTAETIRDGWLDTGDRFFMDAEGYYFYKGRADDMVKVSGQWVWPMEIELALNEHPKVRESCVLAVPMADGLLTIRAFVALVDGVSPDPELTRALQAHARRNLLPHKYPREVFYLADLPKTGTDKIDRQALRRDPEALGARRL